MDYGWIILIAIVIATVAGFVFLSTTLLANWRARSRGKEIVDAEQSERTIRFERCLNECMASEHWDPDKDELCRLKCAQEAR